MLKLNKIIMLLFFILISASLEARLQPTITGVEFVNKTHLGDNLYKMSLMVAKRTQTFAMLSGEIGTETALVQLKKQLSITAKKYQGEWNQNLAESYLEYFSVLELNSIYYDRRESKFANKMKKMQPQVAYNMQSKSIDLLEKVVSESLATLWKNHDLSARNGSNVMNPPTH